MKKVMALILSITIVFAASATTFAHCGGGYRNNNRASYHAPHNHGYCATYGYKCPYGYSQAR